MSNRKPFIDPFDIYDHVDTSVPATMARYFKNQTNTHENPPSEDCECEDCNCKEETPPMPSEQELSDPNVDLVEWFLNTIPNDQIRENLLATNRRLKAQNQSARQPKETEQDKPPVGVNLPQIVVIPKLELPRIFHQTEEQLKELHESINHLRGILGELLSQVRHKEDLYTNLLYEELVSKMPENILSKDVFGAYEAEEERGHFVFRLKSEEEDSSQPLGFRSKETDENDYDYDDE